MTVPNGGYAAVSRLYRFRDAGQYAPPHVGPGHSLWTPPPVDPVTRFLVQRQSTTGAPGPAGPAREGGRRCVLPHPARLGSPAPLRQRDHRPVHHARRARQRQEPASSTSGSTSRTSRRPGRAFGCSEPAITEVQPAASTSPGLAARQRMTRTRRSTLGTDTALWLTGTSAQKSRRPLKWVTTSGRVSWYNAIRWPPVVRNEQHGP